MIELDRLVISRKDGILTSLEDGLSSVELGPACFDQKVIMGFILEQSAKLFGANGVGVLYYGLNKDPTMKAPDISNTIYFNQQRAYAFQSPQSPAVSA